MLPAWDDRLLPDGQAAFSTNSYLFSGTLKGWRQPKLLHTLSNPLATYAYRLPNKATNNTSITAADSFWLEFTDPDTNVMRTPVVQDTFQRYYFASPSQQPKYNTYDRIVANQQPWLLGIPASGCAPGVTVTGGGDTVPMGFVSVINGGQQYLGANRLIMMPIVSIGSLVLNDIQLMMSDTDTAANFYGVVYTDNGGKPSQLIAQSAKTTGCTAASTVTCTFTNAVGIDPNVTYWIGVMTDKTHNTEIADTNNTTAGMWNVTFGNGAPAALDRVSDTGAVQVPQMWGDFTGSSVFEARAYVYTWVTEYGEEGPPSAATLVNGWSNGTWELSLFSPVANDMGVDRNITKTRIYRTVTSNSGQGVYFYVDEIPVLQGTYQDTSDDATVALNNQMASLFWSAPPTDLQGMQAFPNGVSVGFRSNEVWFSEAYRPHAWPPNYVLTTEFPVIGLGVCGQSIVVCTEGSPYLITGINPSVMSLTKINLPEPCLFRGSIVTTDSSVLYMSQNGLIQVSQDGSAQNVTEQWITRERWQALTPQKYVRAIKHASSYFGFGTVSGSDTSVAQQGFTVELSSADQVSFTIWPQAGGHRLGFSQLTGPNSFNIYNVMVDPWTGVGLLLQNAGVYYYDFTDQSPTLVPYTWRSKIYQQMTKKNYSACRIFFSVPPNTPTQVARNTADPQPTLGANQYGIIRFYADGTLLTTREIRTSGELLRVYSGTKVEQWQIEIEGRVEISNVQVATTVKELGLV